MKLVYVRWRDAMKEEAESGGPARPTLMTLEEIGWLAAENEEAITLAMELEPGPVIDGTATTQAGRWRLHVPKVCIEEVREMEFGKAFPKRSIR
jgi:hypothetical protein